MGRSCIESKAGYTLIEVILTVVILGILVVAAFPNFFDFATQAHTSARTAVAAAVQTGIDLYRVQDLVNNGPPGNYPPELDALPNNTDCTPGAPCFGAILSSAVTDGRWHKQNRTRYRHRSSAGAFTYVYSAGNGTFLEQ